MSKHLPMIDRLTRQLTAKGVENPRQTAVEHLQNSGVLRKGSETLTVKGKARTAMGPAGRAKDRAASHSTATHKPSDYKYVGGRAILK